MLEGFDICLIKSSSIFNNQPNSPEIGSTYLIGWDAFGPFIIFHLSNLYPA